jgi:UDP-glucose 4-epimerase
MTRNVLITGGFGYLGGRIASHLASLSDWKVTISTRAADPRVPSWLPTARVIVMDPATSESLVQACEGFDAIVHLVGANEIVSSADPAGALVSTTLGTLRLLQAAQKAGVERFLYFSTVHVYGKPKGLITEQTLPEPTHPYAITHRAAEDFVLASGSPLGVVIRLSNAVGAPTHLGIDRWTLAGNDLCRQAVVERRLTLKSAGLAKRDFLPLHDVCRATEHLLRIPAGDMRQKLFNVAAGRNLSILELAELIASRCEQRFGYRPEIVRLALRPDEAVGDFQFSCERLRTTGFQADGLLVREIDDMLQFCRLHFAPGI